MKVSRNLLLPVMLFGLTKRQIVGLGSFSFQSNFDSKVNNQHFDVAIIGGGSGGIECGIQASQNGLKVVLFDYVEPSLQNSKWGLGGTCLNVGCIPKKLFHTAAIQIEMLHKMKDYGIDVQLKQIDWNILKTNIQNYIKSQNLSYRAKLEQNNITYVNNLAAFKDQNHLVYSKKKESIARFIESDEIDQDQLGQISADYIVIATGGRPNYLADSQCKNSLKYSITSDDLFSLAKAPNKTLVVGGGYIAVECSGFLQALGNQVDIMTRQIFLRSFDQQIVEYILQDMKDKGINVMDYHLPVSIERNQDGKYDVEYMNTMTKQKKVATYDTVLQAVGRTANIGYLNLKKVGLETEKGKVKGNAQEYERTNVDNIFSVGDVNSLMPELQPIALRSGSLLGQRISLLKQRENVDDQEQKQKLDSQYKSLLFDMSLYPTTIFSTLEYGLVGMNQNEAEQKYGNGQVEVYHIKSPSLEDSILSDMKANNYYQLVVNKGDQKVLGVHYLGANAAEIIQGLAIALKLGICDHISQESLSNSSMIALQFILAVQNSSPNQKQPNQVESLLKSRVADHDWTEFGRWEVFMRREVYKSKVHFWSDDRTVLQYICVHYTRYSNSYCSFSTICCEDNPL